MPVARTAACWKCQYAILSHFRPYGFGLGKRDVDNDYTDTGLTLDQWRLILPMVADRYEADDGKWSILYILHGFRNSVLRIRFISFVAIQK